MLSSQSRTLRRSAGIMFSAIAAIQAAPVHAALLHIDLLPNGAQTSTENTGASGLLTFEFFDGAQDTFTLRIENTTPLSLDSLLTGIALELPDSLTELPVFAPGGTSSYFDELDYDVRATPSWLAAPGGYDLVITSDGNFRGGPPTGAPESGEWQQITFSLGNTPFDANQLFAEFQSFYSNSNSPFALGRFQGVGLNGTGGSDFVVGYLAVPEPSTLAFLALASVATFFRRKTVSRIVP